MTGVNERGGDGSRHLYGAWSSPYFVFESRQDVGHRNGSAFVQAGHVHAQVLKTLVSPFAHISHPCTVSSPVHTTSTPRPLVGPSLLKPQPLQFLQRHLPTQPSHTSIKVPRHILSTTNLLLHHPLVQLHRFSTSTTSTFQTHIPPPCLQSHCQQSA